MKLSADQVEHLAKLARLKLSEKEKSKYADELSAILEYVDLLSEVETENVVQTNQVTGLEDVFREDVAVGCAEDTRKAIIDCFPDKEGDLLRVPGVFE